ncbi:AMP-dependent synthetase [Rhodococcus qingshengii]|nr:AMP-dependent synthetase [Rhodococcus sp. BH4]KLN73208.1 AMP-dependent synthetase [Rhodococcus erythropolis]KZL34683.1 AMP-dependent synthetase [Rhodococcus qingshengii]MBQ9054493.1 lipopolysaccharide biosynthesis protein [Rhodococcus sp. (in: high G+C Gram-positive bacteria)]MCE4163696.1 lipopolysaccharide biosynthesis protein [Rhodococcus sp. Ni2]
MTHSSPVTTVASPETPATDKRKFEYDSIAVLISGAVTAVLGLVFWAVTARMYPVDVVGRASAVINSAVVLSTLSTLSLGSMYERFLPLAGSRAGALVARGYLLVALLATILATALLMFGPREKLFSSGWAMLSYVGLVVTLALFALEDQTTNGLRVARWSAAKNIVHAIAKLALVASLAFTAHELAVVGAWGGSAAIAALVLGVAIRRKLRTRGESAAQPALPPARELWSYFGHSYGLMTLGSLAPLAVPLVVISLLGAEENAYFAITWALVSALFVLFYMLMGPFVSEASAFPTQIQSLTRRFIALLSGLAVLGAIFLALVAPVALGSVGDHYRTEGTTLLRLSAIIIPISALVVLHNALARVYQRMGSAVVAQVLNTIVVIAGSIVLTPHVGIAGVGWSYLAAEILSAAIVSVPLVGMLRRAARTPTQIESNESTVDHQPGA